jgi:hypothetical protein
VTVTDFHVVASFNAAANADDLDGGVLRLDRDQQAELDRARHLIDVAPTVVALLEAIAAGQSVSPNSAALLLRYIHHGSVAGSVAGSGLGGSVSE